MSTEWTHAELVKRAAKWLSGTMRCGVVLCECASGTEQPDAIGWKRAGHHSILVEVKVSRTDFLKDKKKWFRRQPEYGLGQERWYLTPPGLVKPEELPESWGLAEAKGKIVRKIVKPPKLKCYDQKIAWREISLLFGAMRKVALGVPPDTYQDWERQAESTQREKAWQYVAEFLLGRLQIDSRKTGREVEPLGAYFERAMEVYTEFGDTDGPRPGI